MSQPRPPQIDLSGPDDDPILQGIDNVIVFTFSENEELAETDIFRQVFRRSLDDEQPLGVTEGYTIDMDTREARLVIDGETTRKWFREDSFSDENREFPIYCQYQHTDVDGTDREDSGIELVYRFCVTVARGQRA